VEVLGVHSTVAARRQDVLRTPTLETNVFVPYFESNLASSYGATSLAEYSQACNNLILSRLHHVIEDGIHNGLQNRELMCRVFSQQIATCSTWPSDKLSAYLDAADCSVIKTLDKVVSVDHSNQFREDVQSVMKSAWSDIAVVDKLTSFIRNDRCFKTCLDVIVENSPFEGSNPSLKIVEYDAGIGRAFQHTIRQLSSQPAVSVKYFATGLDSVSTENGQTSDLLGITTLDWSLSSGKPAPDQIRKSDVVILANVLHRQSSLVSALKSLKELLRDGGFLLAIEPTKNFAIPWAFFALANDLSVMADLSSRSFGPFCDESTWIRVFADAGLEVVAQKSDGLLNTVFLCRNVSQAVTASCPHSVDVDDSSFKWLEELKTVMAGEQSRSGNSVWLTSQNNSTNGIIGMVNCLRREPNGRRLR
jgi:fatty acid synthase